MKTSQGWAVGVCSWSYQMDIPGVTQAMRAIGLEHIHLALGPALAPGGGSYFDFAARQRWIVTSAMIDFPQEDYSSLESIRRTGGIVPDAEWGANRRRVEQALRLAHDLGTPHLSMHAGFLDHTQPAYARKFTDRIRALADAAGELDMTLLLETGQESAADLRQFLEEMDHAALGVNFDPANMILYDKDPPLQAVQTLAPWIRHVHAKDAVRTRKPNEWGTEVPWGDGDVRTEDFLNMLSETGFTGAIAIEREAGDQRVADIALAAQRLAMV